MPSLLDMDAFMKGQSAQTNTLGTTSSPFNGDIHGLIDEVSLTEGVDPELVRALVKLESGFNPNAKNPGSSASGLMQLVKGTADEMGVQNVFDPRQNLTGGVRYLKKHLDSTGGDVEKALAMYNQGPAGDLSKAQGYVDKIKEFYGKDFTPPSTPDLSSLISQYGVDPYPKSEPFKLNIPTIPSIVPEIADDGSKFRDTAVGRGFTQALNSPQPEVGKLPFGIENKGGPISKWAKDVLYGLPEGVMTLGAGLVGLPAAAIGGTAKAMTSGLAAGGDTFNEIAATSIGHPQTATAQYMMKPFEVIFGGILNSGAEVVKDLNPTATPEELDSKVKATQFVMNLAMVAPMFKGAVKGRGKVDVENPAKSLDQHEVTPEVVEGAKAQVLADPAVAPEVKAQVGGIDVGVLQSIQKKAATSVAKERVQKAGVPEAKFPENQSIVEGLLTEVELREGRAKTTMRKAAQIVAQHEGDIALADLSGIKGINVKGSTGKAIARLIEERDARARTEAKIAEGVGDDVPLDLDTITPPTPRPENQKVRATTKVKIDGKESTKTVIEETLPDGTRVTKTVVDGVDLTDWEPLGKESKVIVNTNPDTPFKNVIHEKSPQIGKPTETSHITESGYVYRSVGESEISAIQTKGEALAPEKSKGGRRNVKHWSKGDGRLAYREDQSVIRVKADNIHSDKPVSINDLEIWNHDTGKFESMSKPKVEEPVVEAHTPVADPIPEMIASIDPSLKYDGKMAGIPEAGIPDTHNLTLTLEDGRHPSFSISGEVTPEKIATEVQKVKEKFAPKVEGPTAPIQVAEPTIISEFDSTPLAQAEGYTFPDKNRYSTIDRAQAKAAELGDGYEVVKVKGKYKVAKFEETSPIVEFTDEGAVNRAGLELMSEIPADKVKFESPTVGEGFGLAKVGDKYYRTSPLVDMPERGAKVGKSQREPIVDGVSASDWEALKAFTDEATLKELRAKDTLKELANVAKLEEVKSPETNAALAQAFVEWRDSYVTKCNVAKPTQNGGPPVGYESTTPIKGFHGTQKDVTNLDVAFAGTSTDYGFLGEGLYFFTDKAKADRYANRKGRKGKTLERDIYIKNPATEEIVNEIATKIFADDNIDPQAGAKLITQELKSLGYDGVIAENRGEMVVFDNEQVGMRGGKPAKKLITKESLAPFDDSFKTFKSIEDAKEWVEATGAVGELIPDPLTGKVSFMNTEKLKGLEEMDLWDEGVEQLAGRQESRLEDWDNPEMEMSETGVRDLFSIFNNERGSVDVTPLYSVIDAVNKVVADAKKMGKSIDDYLAHIGMDEVAIAAFKAAMARVPQMKEQLKEQDPVTSAILMPEGKVVAQTVIRNRNKEVKSVGPPITEELANRAMSANRSMQWGTDIMRVDPETGKVRVEHTTNAFEKAMQATEVKINSFRAAGLSEIYSQWREAKSAAEHEKSQVKEWLDGLESQIAPERREAFALAAYGDMKSVKEALGTMGITEIPQLTPKESAVLEQLFDYTRKFRDRANYIRTHTGQKAIPQLKDMSGRENYLPLMRDLNVLRDMGLTEGLTISDSKKLGELSKKFNGMFNPNAKKRNVSDIPIELDPFKALRRHADYGIAEIHISPVAALAKDLANLKLPRPDGVKGKVSLVDWNPNLSRMLSRWSDQIVGKDVVATAMANANPFFAWFKDRLSKNLVVATIGGSLRTVLVQPTSYIIGIPTMLDMRSAGYGIAKLMSERPFGKSNARQNSSVLAIREADYAFKELSDYIQQGKMSGTVGYLAEKSLAPMKWVDSVMAEAGWNAARYYGEKRLKLQGKELYRFADDVVERTQGLGIKGAVSDVQSSAATKWLTLLQTFAIADFNLIARDVLGIKNPEANQGKTIMRVAKYTAATILAGQMYKMMGLDNVVPDPIGAYEEAKKDGKGDLRAVGATAGELLEKVPLIGGSAKYSSSLFGIAGEWGSILPEAGEKFAASLDWKKLTPKQRAYNIKLIARAVGMTAGVPMTNQILKSINAYSKGGNPYQVILGVYEVEKKKKGGLRPEIPRPPSIPRPF